MKPFSLTLGPVGLLLLTLAVLSAGCGGPGIEIRSTAPPPTLVTEPTSIVSPTPAVSTPTAADELSPIETSSSSADTNMPKGAATERIMFTKIRILPVASCCPQPDVARAATRVQALEGIRNIEVTDEAIVVVYEPEVVTLEAIVTAFSLQGLEVEP